MLRKLFCRSPRTRKPARRAFRPALELLEHRLVPATLTWNQNASGDFGNPLNWDVGGTNPVVHRVPQDGDDVSISQPGAITVTYRSGDIKLQSLHCNEILAMTGGKLGVHKDSDVSQLDVGAAATFSLLDAGSTMFLHDNSQLAGTINAVSGSTFTLSGGTTDGHVPLVLEGGAQLLGDGQYVAREFALIDVNTNLQFPTHFLDGAGHGSVVLNQNCIAGSDFTLSGTLTGPANLDVPSGSTLTWSSGALGGAGATNIRTGGTLILQSPGSHGINDQHVLNNSGTINFQDINTLSLASAAVINNQSGGQFNMVNDGAFSGGTFNNLPNGTFTMPAGTTLVREVGTFTNSGTVNVHAGTLELRFGTASGTFNTDPNAGVSFTYHDNTYTYTIAGGQLHGLGLYSVTNGGRLKLNSDVSVQNVSLTNGGSVEGTGKLQLTKAMTWDSAVMIDPGVTEVAHGAVLTIPGNQVRLTSRTINNYGTINWSGNDIGVFSGGVVNNAANGTFNIQSDHNIWGDGTGTVTNAGTITKTSATGSGMSVIGGVFHNTGPLNVHSGVLGLGGPGCSGSITGRVTVAAGGTVAGGGTVAFRGGNYSWDAGTVFAGAGLVQVTDTPSWGAPTINITAPLRMACLNLDDGVLVGLGTLTVTNSLDWTGGTIGDVPASSSHVIIPAGAALTLHGTRDKWLYGGTLDVAGAATWSDAGRFRFGSANGGTLNVTGTFTAANNNGQWLQLYDGGILTGSGTITANVQNWNGTVRPGAGLGTLTINGDFSQLYGTLVIDVGGAAANQYDRLVVTGTATLGGTLSVSLVNNFVPAVGDAFRVLTFASRSGDFGTMIGLTLPNGKQLAPTYSATDLTLVAS